MGCAQELKTPQSSICEEPRPWPDDAGRPAPRAAPRPRPLHPEGPRAAALAGQEDPHLRVAHQGGVGGAAEEGEVVAGLTPPQGKVNYGYVMEADSATDRVAWVRVPLPR